VLLAGDTFENNQLNASVLDCAGRLLANCGAQIVILPGNHDPALPDSIFMRGGFDRIRNVYILGVTHDEAVCFPAYDLEVWGTTAALAIAGMVTVQAADIAPARLAVGQPDPSLPPAHRRQRASR
jgi:hypothetical protein